MRKRFACRIGLWSKPFLDIRVNCNRNAVLLHFLFQNVSTKVAMQTETLKTIPVSAIALPPSGKKFRYSGATAFAAENSVTKTLPRMIDFMSALQMSALVDSNSSLIFH